MGSTYEVTDKVFLITGAAAGLGAAFTRAFLQKGAKHVAILDVAEKAGLATERELNSEYGSGKVKFFRCDFTDDDQLSNVFKNVVIIFKKIDVLINNAGIMNDNEKIYKKMIEVNVTALVSGSLKAYELMRMDRGGAGGTIINIASIVSIVPTAQLCIYSATKSAVMMFTKCLGMEPHYSRSGVRVLCIGFGATDTSLLDKAKFGAIDPESTAELDQILGTAVVQRVESAVAGMMAAYLRGRSTSVWMAVDDKPPADVTDDVSEGFNIFTRSLF